MDGSTCSVIGSAPILALRAHFTEMEAAAAAAAEERRHLDRDDIGGVQYAQETEALHIERPPHPKLRVSDGRMPARFVGISGV